jgi:plastocyanin
MRRSLTGISVTLGALAVIAGSNAARLAADSARNAKIAILDDCDPTDPGWAPTGGCFKVGGLVRVAEFNAFLASPLSTAVVGHPAWRMQPSYDVVEMGRRVKVENLGGRTHTFTEVAQYGGGRVPPLNMGLVMAPECAAAMNIPAGGRTQLSDLSAGNHKFQCCIHPWMRAAIKVVDEH